MELNFLYNDGSHLKKISFNATEITDQTFLISQVGGFSEGVKNVGWCPKINNANFRTTEPRYFGTSGSRSALMGPGYTGDYNRFFPDSLVSAIKKYPAANTYTLTTSSNFLGTKPAGNQKYTGVPLLREVDGAYKKVCNLLWAYREQPIPGQSVHSYIKAGLFGFSYPSDEFPDASMYAATNDRNEYQFTGDLPSIKMSLWIITVQDDVTGSVSYGKEYRLLAQVIDDYVSFIDMRLLNGADEEGQPIPNGSEPKKNSTPKGWSGQRNTRTSTDLPTQCPSAVVNSVNFGTYGLHLYECSNEAIDQLSGILFNKWVKHLFDDWEPVTGILSLHKLPYAPDSEMQPGLPDKDYPLIHLAGHDAKADGTSYDVFAPGGVFIPENVTTYEYECHGREILGGQTLESDVIEVQPFFGSFLDFEPYTKVQVRLPFIGIVSIPTSACMGGKLKVNYVLDNRNGNCVAQILCWSMRNSEIDSGDDSDNYMIVGQYSGNCAMPAAIAGNSTGGEVRMGIVRGFASSAVAMGAGVALGAVSGPVAMAGVIGSAANAAVNYGSVKETPTIVGSLNTEAACLHDLTVRVLITRPVDVTPGDFKVVNGERVFTASSLLDQKGLASYSGGNVGQYEGMTIGYIRGAIEGATETEMTAIKNAFLGGVIV